jgi:hypothetical protein
MADYLVPTNMLRWKVVGRRPRVLEQMWREHPSGEEVWQEVETVHQADPEAYVMHTQDEVAHAFMEVFLDWASEDEGNLDIQRRDHYKPLYRAATTFVAHSSKFWGGVLSKQTPDLEEAKSILRRANVYWVKALAEDEVTFDRLYRDMVDTWLGEKDECPKGGKHVPNLAHPSPEPGKCHCISCGQIYSIGNMGLRIETP